MRFEVHTLAAGNVIERQWIEAQDESDARRQAAELSLTVMRVRRARGGQLQALGTHSRFSLTLFSQELLALLNAGLSLVECMDAVCEKDDSTSRKNVVSRIARALREGSKLSAALAQQPEVFPALYVGLVEAAEGTGELPRTLTRYIDYQSRIDAVRSKILSAAIYPTILLIVGSGVSLFLLGFVVPRFALIYKDAGRDLPGLSQLMLDVGGVIGGHPWKAACAAGLVCMSVAGLIFHAYRTGGLERLIRKVPGVGRYLHLYELSRLYLTLGMLIEGGIPLVKALRTSSRAASSSTRNLLAKASEQIECGRPLSDAFAEHQLTTAVSLRMLRAGERSGEIGTMLTRAAVFYDGDISRFVDRFTRAFEPALMAIIGTIVGLIVVTLYMPIFDLAGSIQ